MEGGVGDREEKLWRMGREIFSGALLLKCGSIFLSAGLLLLSLPLLASVGISLNVWLELGAQMTALLVAAGGTAYVFLRQLRQTESLAISDGLTGLYNYRYFQDRLREELARAERHEYPVSLVMMDIDHFKRFNTMYGHQAGDKILKHIATILRRNVRTVDLPVRYGGEELTLLLPRTDKVTAGHLAERIRSAVESVQFHPRSSRQSVRVTISAGVASYPAEATTAEELVARADEALFEAKRAGRNLVRMSEGEAPPRPSPLLRRRTPVSPLQLTLIDI